MFGSVLSAIGAIQMVLSFLMLGYLALSAWKSRRTSFEEDERAVMRSMSWPAAR